MKIEITRQICGEWSDNEKFIVKCDNDEEEFYIFKEMLDYIETKIDEL
jgi:hypothetical protein